MTIKVGLVQINNSFSGQNYFPYSVGLLQVYARKYLKNPSQYDFLLPIYSRVKIEKAYKHLANADIIFFSAYVWNIRLSLKIAQKVKLLRPDVVIAFGGPQVPDHAEEFLRINWFVDLACHKEGESIVCPLLENAPGRNWKEVPSISYLDSKGKYIQNPLVPRIRNLDEIPSPYLEGVFDSLIEAYPHEQWLVMWETNRGCPFSCTYCDWGSATQSKISKFGLERLCQEVDWISKHKIEFIFCCDANFGILKRDYDIAKYVANNKKRYTYPHVLSVQNTKNVKERAYKIQKYLSDNALNKGVTLSVQSLDKTTLKNVKRENIILEDYQELQVRFTKDKVETYSDMIVALPGETYDSFIDGISNIIENGQHNRIQFNNLCVLPNVEMGNPEYQKKFGMEIVETDIINIHGSLLENEEICEKQQLVIATSSMPRKDWVRTRAICWMSAFLYFDKIMQIPFILLHKVGNLTFRELIETFAGNKIQQFPLLREIHEVFLKEARKIQNGGAEYCESTKWLNIWWPADELQLIHLCTENRIDEFYGEAKQLLKLLLKEKQRDVSNIPLEDAIQLNKCLIKLPSQTEDSEIQLSHNIWEVYQHHLVGIDLRLEKKPCTYAIDKTSQTWASWEQWCKEVIWYGNKKGAYLYKIKEEVFSAELVQETSINQVSGHY